MPIKKMKKTLFFITILIVSVFLPELKAQNTIDSLKYLLKTTKNDTIQIDVLLQISETYINTKLDSSIYYCDLALDNSEKSQNELKKPFCLMQFGSIYFSKGLFDKSLKNYLEALNIFTKLDNENEIAACYNSIANIYYRQKKFDIALEYYKKTLQIDIESGNEYYVSFTYNNIGNIYLELDKNEMSV